MLKTAARNEIYLLSERYPKLGPLQPQVTAAVELLAEAYHRDKKIFVCGNGGSAADSIHIVGELMKGFTRERPLPADFQEEIAARFPKEAPYYIANLQSAIPCASLVSEIGLLSAYSNDCKADLVYAQQLVGQGRRGDVLIAVSTSGNSPNILHAARIAQVMGIRVIALTGQEGGSLRNLASILLNVPAVFPYQVQEYHLPIYHAICLALEAEIFECGAQTHSDTAQIGGSVCM